MKEFSAFFYRIIYYPHGSRAYKLRAALAFILFLGVNA